jgi:hypothetical protein
MTRELCSANFLHRIHTVVHGSMTQLHIFFTLMLFVNSLTHLVGL